MRIAKFALDGNGAWPDLRATALDDGLTLFVGQPSSGKSTVVRFIGHVLYGRQPLRHTLPAAATTVPPEGELVVDVSEGNYRLRRYNDVSPPGRLTVSSLSGAPADQHTVHKMLSGVSPSILSQLYIADFNSGDSLRQLLTEEFANGFQLPGVSQSPKLNRGLSEQHSANTLAILNRRDDIARELESRLSSERRHSDELKAQLQELSSQRQQRRREIDAIQLRLRAVELSLAEIEARLRYDQVEATVNHEQAQTIPDDLEAKLADVDDQIDLWRTTLSDLERREAQVRDRLTQIHPNDAAARLPLADQRTHLGVVRRLLSDLEGEVSRLAQASGSNPSRANQCVCSDAHPRFRPIVETLSKHLALLDDSLQDQEQTVEYQDLLAEAEHIGRSRHELRQQLEHLLQRRQTLLRSGRPTRHNFRRDASQRPLHEVPNAIHGYDLEQLEAERTRLAHERAELKSHYEAVARGLDELERRYQDLSHNRVNLLSGGSIDELRSELAAIERQLHHSSSAPVHSPTLHSLEGAVRASDFLAQLSSGRLTQVELIQGGRNAQVTTQQGSEASLESLSHADRVLVHLSLVLSLVSAHARSGIHLPLVLDEPFAQLSAPLSAPCRSAVCNVLNEFAQSGHQVLLFTRDTEAASHFRHIGRSVIDMQQLRCASDADVELVSELKSRRTIERVREQTPKQTPKQTVSVAERPNSPFHLQLDCSIADFPALGRETKEAFGDIGIHTVGDLVDAEPETIAKRLERSTIDAEIVRLWQTHLLLMCFVPGVSLSDAQILSGAGIESPEELVELTIEQIWQQVSDYLATDRGERFRSRGYRVDREAAAAWVAGAKQHSQRWSNSRHASRWRERRSRWVSSRRSSSQRSSRRATNSTRSSSRSRTRERSERTSTRSQTTRRLETRSESSSESSRSRLQSSSPVVDAPSIGPKTADRLAVVGITTIADLLSADPKSTAAELDVRHIKPATIKAWQHQARLSLAMPKLLSRDAQVLVGCGFKTCQQISIMAAGELYSVVVPFCQSKEGERILRDGDPPTQERVAEWIEWASQTNQIEAA